MKITGSPNMVNMVNRAMEDLQHKILLDFFKYCLLHCHVKIERGKTQTAEGTVIIEQEEREKQKSND